MQVRLSLWHVGLHDQFLNIQLTSLRKQPGCPCVLPSIRSPPVLEVSSHMRHRKVLQAIKCFMREDVDPKKIMTRLDVNN
eukprot:2565917-Amphidinium_carterae.1